MLSQHTSSLQHASQKDGMQRVPLADSLRLYSEEDAEPPPPQLLKKYVAYARAHVHPQLSAEAKQVGLLSTRRLAQDDVRHCEVHFRTDSW